MIDHFKFRKNNKELDLQKINKMISHNLAYHKYWKNFVQNKVKDHDFMILNFTELQNSTKTTFTKILQFYGYELNDDHIQSSININSKENYKKYMGERSEDTIRFAKNEMFDIENRDHINRYDEGEEWLLFLNNIFSNKKFNKVNGKYFKTTFSYTSPKLHKTKKINSMSAAFSPQGRLFAAKNVNSIITMFSNYESLKKQIKNIKREAKKHKNNIKVYGLVHIVCRKTDKIAEEYYEKYASKLADKEAILNFISILNKSNKSSVLASLQKSQVKKMAGGIGSYPIIGSPMSVRKQINNLKEIGLDGIAMGFVNFKDELPYFIKKLYNKFNQF